MKSQFRKKGMSLLEVLITVAVFGIFALLISSLVISAARNYQRGKLMQEVRLKTSSALKMMEEDIRRGIVLQTLGSGSWVPSAVLAPNPYGRESIAQKSNEGWTENRLIVVDSTQSDIKKYDVSDPLLDLRFVEYRLTNNNKTLERRTFDVATATSGSEYTGFKRDTGQWIPVANFFDAGSPKRTDVIAQLTGRNDVMYFKVDRPKLLVTDPSYNVTYERHMYNLLVRMTKYIRDDINEPVTYEEVTQVKTVVR
ncbi:MAG: type II secretion system GspH family protein [Firmicutes bacterium]|nr:type II secretion system GspH family protein [Bacillota bacterium]